MKNSHPLIQNTLKYMAIKDNYQFKLSHDKGEKIINIKARHYAAAINMVMETENCPREAIKLIKIKRGK